MPVRCYINSLACLPLSGSSLSNNFKNSGVREMGSVPHLPLELDIVYADQPLILLELGTSLPFPPDTLPSSPKGENRLCSVVGLSCSMMPGRFVFCKALTVALECRTEGA